MSARAVHSTGLATASLFGELSGDSPRVFLGPAPFSHRHDRPEYGTTAWYIATELDDWNLGPFPDALTAGMFLMGAEIVLLAERLAGREV